MVCLFFYLQIPFAGKPVSLPHKNAIPLWERGLPAKNDNAV
jgi:hypothetical protein